MNDWKDSTNFRTAFLFPFPYIPTLRTQGYSVLDGLTSVLAGNPLMPRLDA